MSRFRPGDHVMWHQKTPNQPFQGRIFPAKVMDISKRIMIRATITHQEDQILWVKPEELHFPLEAMNLPFSDINEGHHF